MMKPRPEEDGGLEKLSREELKKIEKSMKRPEFMGLLNEYMVEISDPKNKSEYDEYLRQMEREGELPKHMKLVKLKPHFCFRTQIVSTKNKKHQMKFFVNMCSSEYIEKPSCEPGPQASGFNWKIPNSMGKIRYDQDVHKEPCQVVDCAFHPDTFQFAAHPSFQAMIIGIALESAEKQLGERKETLSRDYVILKKVKCKSENGEPALLPIRYIDGKAYSRGEGPAELERDTEGKETKLQKEITKQKQEFDSLKVKDSQKDSKNGEEEEEEGEDEAKKLITDLDTGIQTPKYTSIYTYKTDYSEFIDGPGQRKARKLPSTFTIELKVPRMENISEASRLQISEQKIVFAVDGKYYLDLLFSEVRAHHYPLKTSEAKAKFDKKKKILKIAIPLDVEKLPDEPEPEQLLEEENEQKIVENETWKSKVLEFGEQAVDTKFIEQSDFAAKPEKKLVEEIDEDDIEQSDAKAEDATVRKAVQDEEDEEIRQKEEESGLSIEGQKFRFGKNFSLRSYYPKDVCQLKREEKVQSITNYLFKQSYDKKVAIISIPLRNYEPEQVQMAAANGQMILHWRAHNQGVHFCIRKEMQDKLLRITAFQRVGFCAFVIELKNPSEVTGEELLFNFLEQDNEEWREMENFLQNLHTISHSMQAEQRKREEEAQPTQQAIAKAESVTSATQQKPAMEEIDEDIQQPAVTAQTNMFEKIPAQFIRFNAPFIDVLN